MRHWLLATTAAVFALALAGCLAPSPTAGPPATPTPATTPEEGLRFVLVEEKVTIEPISGATRPEREGTPWCAPATYRFAPVNMTLHFASPPDGARGIVVREFGDGETFQHHDRGLLFVPASGSIIVPSAYDDERSLFVIAFGPTVHLTGSSNDGPIAEGESREAKARYRVSNEGASFDVEETIRVTNAGLVEPDRVDAPCD